MKLSKRIKQFRRGRHTKRSGKHTRRKYRGKQYKRTYRKNNRKLKNNKRIQRGGAPITTSPEVKWDKTNTTNYLLRYTKKGSIFYESKPFDITFEFIQSNNSIGLSYKLPDGRYPILSKYFYGTFKVTMTRKTSDGKVFVVYFAVYGIERKVTYDDGTTKPSIHPVVVYSSDKNFEDIPHKMIDKLDSPCYGLSGVTADISKESYDFPCGNNGGYQECDGNRKFFFSLIKKMFEMGKKEYDDAKKAKADKKADKKPAKKAEKKDDKKEPKLPKSSGKLMDLKKEVAYLKEMSAQLQATGITEGDEQVTEAEFSNLQKFVSELSKVKMAGAELKKKLDEEITATEAKIKAEKDKIKEMIGLISEEPAEDKKKAKVDEKLKPSMGAGTYVKDFEKSKAPQFKGKSKAKKQKMAVAAYLTAKDKK